LNTDHSYTRKYSEVQIEVHNSDAPVFAPTSSTESSSGTYVLAQNMELACFKSVGLASDSE